MSSQFPIFAKIVRRNFDSMATGKLYAVASDKDAIWAHYLASFPEGTDPMFRKRTEHDCSCCRSFIRNAGNIVAFDKGRIATIWDITGLPHPYDVVAERMAAYVRGLAIKDVFLTWPGAIGQEKSIELLEGNRTQAWNHFSVTVPRQFINRDFVAKQGELRTSFEVFKRGLLELTPSVLDTVIELIKENALYRGAEAQKTVKDFRAFQKKLHGVNDLAVRDALIWEGLDSHITRFRNTAMGTLVQDLSAGMELGEAVRKYEAMVAPQNYKHPTALITKSMVTAAMKTVADLGLEPALERRHARITDVSVESVLFVDNAVAPAMKGGFQDLLMEAVKPGKFDMGRAELITIDSFVYNELPRATSLQLWLDNDLSRNFVSLTAPVHDDAARLFKWDNNFAWSYDGNVTDSIKERVKRAGGRVENVALRVSLAWNNIDDLDLHCDSPDRGHIYYGAKAGILDVDMNVSHYVRDPVENMRWVNMPRDGEYKFYVHQFCQRARTDGGFTVEVEAGDVLTTLHYEKIVADRARVPVIRLVAKGGELRIVPAPGMKVGGGLSQEKWGLKTQELVRVNAVVLSPNHWGDNIAGLKHWFFLLEGAKNPEPVRGIYNEFLGGELAKHAKVLEVLGEKTKCPVADEQLSGVGFTSARGDKVTVLATGPKLNKVYTVAF